MFGRQQQQRNVEIDNMLTEAGILCAIWILSHLWKSDFNVEHNAKTIKLKSGARSNFLFQRPVPVVHLYKINLPEEERIALDSLRIDMVLRTLVVKAASLTEQVPGLEKPDPRIMELYSREFPRPPSLTEFRDLLGQIEQALAPLRDQMISDPLFSSRDSDKSTVAKAAPLLLRMSVPAIKSSLKRANVIALLLFAKNLGLDKLTLREDIEMAVYKSDAHTRVAFDEDIPRGLARLVNLSDEVNAMMQAIRLDPLLRELIVQSQRMIATVKCAETGSTEWGMESRILEHFGRDVPDAPVKFDRFVSRVEKELTSYRKQVGSLIEGLT